MDSRMQWILFLVLKQCTVFEHMCRVEISQLHDSITEHVVVPDRLCNQRNLNQAKKCLTVTSTASLRDHDGQHI